MTLAQTLINEMNNISGQKEPGQRLDENGQPVCFYCGELLDEADIDHVVPTKLGGIDHPFNKVASCPSCNRSKNGSHPAYYLLQHLEGLPDEQMTKYLAHILYHSLVAPESKV